MRSCRSRAMRVRSSSAPDGTESGEPAGVVDGERRRLGEAGQQLDVSLRERARAGGARPTMTPDQEASGLERARTGRRPPGSRARARSTGAGRARARPAAIRRAARRTGGGSSCGEEGVREPGAVPTGRRTTSRRSPRRPGSPPCRRSSRSRSRSIVLSRASSRSSEAGELLRDLVEAEEQLVGVGQPAHAVEGLRLALIGLAGDASGVAGDERHEQRARPPTARPAARRPGARCPSVTLGMPMASVVAPASRIAVPKPATNPATDDRGEQREGDRAIRSSRWQRRRCRRGRPRRPARPAASGVRCAGSIGRTVRTSV